MKGVEGFMGMSGLCVDVFACVLLVEVAREEYGSR